jgi:hypothetical protein
VLTRLGLDGRGTGHPCYSFRSFHSGEPAPTWTVRLQRTVLGLSCGVRAIKGWPITDKRDPKRERSQLGCALEKPLPRFGRCERMRAC